MSSGDVVVEDIPSGRPFEEITHTSKALEFRVRLARELARGGLAFVLALIFGLTIYWAFKNVGGGKWEDTKQLLDVIIPAESALLGAAVAFFFGLP